MLKESQLNAERLKGKIVSLDRQIDRLTDGFADGTIPADIVKPRIELGTGGKARHRSRDPTPLTTPSQSYRILPPSKQNSFTLLMPQKCKKPRSAD